MAASKVLNRNQARSVVAAYKKGESSRAIAERFGIHRSTVLAEVRAAAPDAVRRPGGSKPRKTAATK